jgi:hypothetical protein
MHDTGADERFSSLSSIRLLLLLGRRQVLVDEVKLLRC